MERKKKEKKKKRKKLSPCVPDGPLSSTYDAGVGGSVKMARGKNPQPHRQNNGMAGSLGGRK
jgi:hypothetical protein